MSDVPTPDKLPEELKAEIDGLFPQSPERCKIAYELMFWDNWPSTDDFKKIGSSYGRSGSTVRDVVDKLIEEKLFDKKKGSIPFYNYLREKATLAKETGMGSGIQPRMRAPTKTEQSEIEQPEEESSVASGDLNVDSEEAESDDMEAAATFRVFRGKVDERFMSLEEKFNKFERGISTDIGKLSESVEKVVNALSKTPENPSSDPTPIPAEAPKASTPESLNPFAGMRGEEVYEMYLNQPDAFAQLLGRPIPADALAEGSMSALPATVRRIIVELTAYTQIAYEKAVNDGAFDGSLSDFLNQCAYKYFADRGIVLEWRRKPPGYPDQQYPRRYG